MRRMFPFTKKTKQAARCIIIRIRLFTAPKISRLHFPCRRSALQNTNPFCRPMLRAGISATECCIYTRTEQRSMIQAIFRILIRTICPAQRLIQLSERKSQPTARPKTGAIPTINLRAARRTEKILPQVIFLGISTFRDLKGKSPIL